MSTDFRKQMHIVKERGTYRIFHEVTPGYTVSVQASESHYCIPRKTLPRPEDYDAFEICIAYNGEYINPHTIQGFPEEYCDFFYEEGREAGWVTTKKVQEIVDWLRTHPIYTPREICLYCGRSS